MKLTILLSVALGLCIVTITPSSAQLQVVNSSSATALAQKIAGEGVTISNAVISGGPNARGFFNNSGGTQIGLDSGVILTTGRAKSTFGNNGIDGNGAFPAFLLDANNSLNLPGDINLANAIGVSLPNTRDACVLEFDFIPLGDTIRFNYVFSSEEYQPAYVCEFNDAFAFFISGPGITGLKNIALIPGTSTPVSIHNVNNVKDLVDPLCPNNTQYYIDNSNNTQFTHDGHTTIFTAVSEVQPCQTYHLKMVIMDVGDAQFDSGVFLEAGSLRSEPVKIDSHNPLNEFNLPYLAEGCVQGAIHITRNRKKSFPQSLNLVMAGNAVNGVDVSPIPLTATIPANDSVIIIPITAIPDGISEGHETLKIYISNACANMYSDSIIIELRDIDLLAITPADSTVICRNGSVLLEAVPGYANYSWTNTTTLSAGNINNPLASPGNNNTTYICTATTGTCTARDSVLVKMKTVSLLSKTDVACTNGTTGKIIVSGTHWENPVSYSINNGTFQASPTFSGLSAGMHRVKVKDASGCMDSIQVQLVQSFPDIVLSANPSPATCSIVADGRIEVLASGGNGVFTFSSNGSSFQSSNTLIVPEGTHTVYVKDGNECVNSLGPVLVSKINNVTVDAEPDLFMCEGTSYRMNATSNAPDIKWLPTTALVNANSLSPTTSATSTIKYYVTATDGTCRRMDSVLINVWDAPVPEAGDNLAICYGITATLNGSGGIEYQWTSAPSFVSPTDISNAIVKPDLTTTYYLNVTDINGCTSLQHDEVTVNVTPSVKVFAGRDTLVAINQPLQLSVIETNNSGVDSWEWNTASFLDNPFTASPVATFPFPNTSTPYEFVYSVTGTTSEGCKGTDTIKIKVYQGPEIYVPNAFTPNGDGRNDQLIALPVGIKHFKFLRVFNRWGQMIFNSQNPTQGWDGRITGADQPTGTFIWIAEGIDYTGQVVSRKGMSTLIR
jgi:gliding motility-associated-like protein